MAGVKVMGQKPMGTGGDFFDNNRSCEYHGDSETADEVCKAGEEGAERDGEDMQGSASAERLLVEGKRRKKPMQMITAVGIS
jgi:hypothetical protein